DAEPVAEPQPQADEDPPHAGP
ncbi:MAG: hypothetical protein QG661_1797, partial [Actinomycetota bacterium]|nr:hypothetical protein [Actinomycetota bacterium]